MKKWITFDLDGTLMQNPFGKWVFPEVEELISNQLQRQFKSTEALVREHELRMQQNRTVEAYDWDEMVKQLLAELQIELEIDVEQLVLKHSIDPKNIFAGRSGHPHTKTVEGTGLFARNRNQRILQISISSDERAWFKRMV